MRNYGYTDYGQFQAVRLRVNLTFSEKMKLHSTYKEWLTIGEVKRQGVGVKMHMIVGVLPNQSLSQFITDLKIARAKTAVAKAQEQVMLLEYELNGTKFHYLDEEVVADDKSNVVAAFNFLEEDVEDDLPF
jgi:hypothetical protein